MYIRLLAGLKIVQTCIHQPSKYFKVQYSQSSETHENVQTFKTVLHVPLSLEHNLTYIHMYRLRRNVKSEQPEAHRLHPQN